MRYEQNLVVLDQTVGTYVLQRFVGKLTPSLSASLNVFRSDTDRSATYDFLLVIHGNGPISYRFQDKTRFLLKIAPLTTIVYLTTTISGSLGKM